MSVPQTVKFEMRVRFDHIDNVKGKRERTFIFESFEKMLDRVYKERHRRAYADRMTSATYRMVLTQHGRDVCDACEYAKQRHQDAILGTWFNWG